MTRSPRTLIALALLPMLGAAPAAWGQLGLEPTVQTDAFLQRQRGIEEAIRLNRDKSLPPSQKLLIDAGGWIDSFLFLYDDGFDSSRTLRTNELRLWAGMTAGEGMHEAYVRMRMTYRDWNTGDSTTLKDDDLDGPNLERGWYQFDIGKALEVYGGSAPPMSLKAKLGRDFVQAGSGYAVSLLLDHVQLQAEYLGFETTFVMGKTPASTANIDRSEPVSGRGTRNFWIVEEKYKGFVDHEPFFYFAINSDQTSEDPIDLLQNYDYDSRYFGFGSTGQLAPRLRYTSEWVLERGESYGDRRFLHRDDIKAWAFDNELEYAFDHPTEPRVSLEYMFASGDKERLDSPTNAEGGNRTDHIDSSFVGFGFRDTGLSFAPRLSNIHIWRAGGIFRPLPDVHAVRDLELGTNYFLYHKHRADAAVSDPLADVQSGYLGWEMDYFANYRISSDLYVTVRLGTFFPGKAFSDQTTRTFLLTALTWSF